MKSNVLKSSLAAFVFTLAIVASFAFSTPPPTPQYYQTFGACNEVPSALVITDDNCKTTNLGVACSVEINSIDRDIFTTINGAETVCDDLLKKPL